MNGNLRRPQIFLIRFSRVLDQRGILQSNFSGQSHQAARMIAKGVFILLDVYQGIGLQLVGFSQVFSSRWMYIQQGHDRHLSNRFELNVVAQANQHRILGFVLRRMMAQVRCRN
jgi:hypothetical protein